MNNKNIKKLTERQFKKALSKESFVVTDYYDHSKTYSVFFRRTARSTNPMSSIRVFYSQDTDIHIGSTLIISGEPYIIYSQDAVESETYYTSIANKCNSTLKATVRNVTVDVPVVVLEDRYNLSRGVINTVSGAVIVYGQDNEYTRAISVNDSYNKFGNYYDVQNRFFNDGIGYFYLEQKLAPVGDYTLEYSGETTISMESGNTYQTQFIVKYANVALDPQPARTFTSSDESVATIDSNGLLTMHNAGFVTITCSCADPELTLSEELTITQAKTRTFSITAARNIWNIGNAGYRVFTLHSYNTDDVEDTSTYLDDSHTYEWTTDKYLDKISWSDSDEPYKIVGTISSSISSDAWNDDVRVFASVDGTVVAHIDMVIQRL